MKIYIFISFFFAISSMVSAQIMLPAYQGVFNKPIAKDIFSVTVFINIDANYFVLGEKHFGIGKTCKNIAGVTLGSGLRTGLILNAKLYAEKNAGAGEFGMIPNKDKYYEYYCSG